MKRFIPILMLAHVAAQEVVHHMEVDIPYQNGVPYIKARFITHSIKRTYPSGGTITIALSHSHFYAIYNVMGKQVAQGVLTPPQSEIQLPYSRGLHILIIGDLIYTIFLL